MNRGYYKYAFAVTPSDSTTILPSHDALYIGVAGNVAVHMIEDANTANSVIFTNVPAGATLLLKVDKVFATGTTANNIIGLR